MSRFTATVAALLVVALAAETSLATSPEELGIEMSTTAYEAVCWYENIKQFPKTNTTAFFRCVGKAESYKEQLVHDANFKKNLKAASTEFANLLSGEIMSRLPKEYKSRCEKYLKNSKTAPEANESDSLKDGGKDYPYKGFAYCFMTTLRKSHGDKAIEAVKKERTHSKKDWKKTLLDRENEARKRHTVGPLKILEELNQSAQKWAEVNAKECRMYHSQPENRMYKGKVTIENLGSLVGITGENLMCGSPNTKKEIAAYIAANIWYEEIELYPYPAGYVGQGADPLFPKIGHFSQMVWKESKYVGYGYANNPKCKGLGTYVAAHYYPVGNIIGTFPENVNPPKDG